ncbi:MAG: tRNA (N(6)-L-threonylcarbamoyladenosine(37)-C(2))-methylthiotransferase MtaB [Bacilli bacterium]|nr:tRNA (N(6)-L-threonylcarbamoyladenosine(37)-C(2))-methylthiotransferase MtaB [Bacilli bacterium]MDD4407267.1 tRNA (N(6)-L-threonylcarbamoyladenosine(37)-C(2))-methylthiotransferase MtaB [Bacilli bacterium]
MKVCVLTLGCKVNLYESEVIKEQFINNNFKIIDLNNNPDIIIINTCSVTNQSDSKSRKMIRRAKKINPKSIIVVCGCFAENHKENILSLGVDILIGNKDKSKIIDLINDYYETKKPIVKFYDLNNSLFEDMVISNFEDRTRGFVKIQDGCNNYCSYCVIPYMRGRIRNKDINVAYEEIKTLVNKGYKEIVLTGIHTGSYGTGTDYNLTTLIKKISSLKELKRIRISSIEITEINDEFLKELKINNKICNHLHIPLQSGEDSVLKMMNRKYNIQEYKEIINKIRKIRPNINITTDVIVGFPTETEENFKETINNIKEIKFGKIHVFPYSKRNGTAAAKMKDIVSSIDKKNRSKELINLSLELEHDYYLKFIGQKVKVLIEEVNENYSVGHTSNYIKVIINKKLKQNQEYIGNITLLDKNNVKIL